MKTVLLSLFLLCISSIVQAVTPTLPKGIIESAPRSAPTLTLSDMDGQRTSLHDYRGQWIFVHFWASWCGPCRKEMPHIEKLVKHMQGQKLAFVIINTAENEDTVFAFLGGVAPELQSLLDLDGQVTEQWRPRGLPATYLVDPQGMIRYQALGGRPWYKKPYTDFLKSLLQ